MPALYCLIENITIKLSSIAIRFCFFPGSDSYGVFTMILNRKVSFSLFSNSKPPSNHDVIACFSIASPLNDGSSYSAMT